MTDIELIRSVLSGNDQGFREFYDKNRERFYNALRKRFPKFVTTYAEREKVFLKDLYQESVLDVWNDILSGKINEDTLTGDLSSYLIGIGKNRYRNSSRAINVRKRAHARMAEEETEGHHRGGASGFNQYDDEKPAKKNKGEVEEDGNESAKEQKIIPTVMGVKGSPEIRDPHHDEEITPEQRAERDAFIEKRVASLKTPCKELLRYTWWQGLTDAQILEEAPGLFKTIGQIKMQRHRCQQSLKRTFTTFDKVNHLFIG